MRDNFYLTQSCVKDLEKETTCPFRWKAQWVDGLIPFSETLHMAKGNYFEWLLIGANAKDGKSPEMPLLKNGKKSTDQMRIEEQAALGKDLLFNPSYPDWLKFKEVLFIQKKLYSGKTKGTLDLVVKDMEENHWVIDIKLTSDLTSTRTEYGWGNPWETMDLLQQVHYKQLYQDNFGIEPKIGLIVFDYSPKKRVEFGEITFTDARIVEYRERFKAAHSAINLYEEHGWSKIANEHECLQCPLSCEKRITQYKNA